MYDTLTAGLILIYSVSRYALFQWRLRRGTSRHYGSVDPMPSPPLLIRRLKRCGQSLILPSLTRSRVIVIVLFLTLGSFISFGAFRLAGWLAAGLIVLAIGSDAGMRWYQWLSVDAGLMREPWQR